MVDDLSALKLQLEFAAHLRTLAPTPKKIHIIWEAPAGADLWKFKEVPMVKYGVGQLKSMNPGWNFHVYDLAAVDAYIAAHLPASDCSILRDSHIVTKSDIFRLLVMYHDGGFYQDVDRLYDIPLETLLEPDTRLLLPMVYDMTFTSDMLCAAPGNILFRRAIDIYLCKMREQHGEGLLQWSKLDGDQRHIVTAEAMGTFYAAVVSTLFGRPLWGPHEHARDGDEGRSFADRMRELIAASPEMQTYREVWCDLIVSKHPDCKGITKQELWAAVKMTQWDNRR